MKKSLKTFILVWLIGVICVNIFIFAIPAAFNGKTIIEVVTTVGFIAYGKSNGLFDFEKVKEIIKFAVKNEDKVKSYIDTAERILASTDRDIIIGKFGPSFWTGYAVLMISFVILLICIIIVFKNGNDSKKVFYKLPLISISFSNLIFLVLICLLCMYIPKFPLWLCILLCVVSIVLSVIPLLWSNLASDIAIEKDKEIEDKTAFMKEMTAKAKAIYNANKDNDDFRKLYEAFRYANPMLNDKELEFLLNEIEKTKSKELIDKLIIKLK